ncbi:uncharacterized protein PV09_03503 [Verruconis gallopava]|uniref:Zn(2)-C6 fungal-type domain-containing protein n=1 Tax=Verruconis gallopava TaxID=253628 RepID=A0A0D1YY67_9PEZI|nr:uncharacterized protein PV09_03503 [Verruconis gallopava]KIW05632.1 hypothetical protein PV09_03503 [Verruconis gallopava]
MDAPPDAKRPRLDHESAGPYPPSGHPLRSASTPVGPATQPSHVEHLPPPPVVHSYTAPPASIGPQAHHPGPIPAAPPARENGVDAHRHSYSAATSSGPSTDHAPGYGVGPAHHHSYPAATTQPGSGPPQSAGYDSSRRTSSAERHAGPMAEHQQHGLPHPPPGQQPYNPQMDPQVNGSMPPNGIPYHPPEQYAVGPVAHRPGYPPTPSTAYHPSPIYAQGPSHFVGQPRRKQVRATQACNHCRARKQKCDENRPCGYCSNEGIPCEYREVPPPKTDRHIMQLLEQQRAIQDTMGEMRNMQEAMNQLLQEATGKFSSNQPKLLTSDQFNTSDPSGYANPGGLVTADDVKDIDSALEAEEQVPDQPPSSHETGAQYLVQWPIIKEYFKTAGISSAEYVLEETEKAGTLRPYGSSLVENGQIVDIAYDEEWDEETKEQKTTDPLEDMWGDGPQQRGFNNPPNIGGGNPDGSLDLRSDTIWKLYDSYMRNMWALHPFLDVKWLNAKIEEFVAKHSPYVQNHQTDGHFTMPGMPASSGRPDTPGATIGKRKRPSSASEDNMDFSPSENTRKWQAPKKMPDRSMQNAIILLVLALGRVLMEDRFLLEEFAVKSPSAESSEMSYANSPYDASKPSPRAYMAFETASSPGDMKAATMARGASLDSARSRRPRRSGRIPNIELFPGLAYFAQASDILGNNLGGNSIMHAQAFLLAGIYYGQLGRVTESWSWINEGCRVTTILHNKKKYRDSILSREGGKQARQEQLDSQSTLVSILCWSALQLESDLRAELDQLPKPSQLMYSEPKIVLPLTLVGVSQDEEIQLYYEPNLNPQDILQSYHFQIQFRLTLNRVHAALYSRKSLLPQNRKKRTTVVWSDADTGTLFDNLQNTRTFLGKATKYWWQDSQDLATNLLEARLRAKYYGGEYIILRPYIYNALRWQQDTGNTPQPPFDLVEWVQNHNESERLAAQKRAERRMRGEDPPQEQMHLPKAEISYEKFQNDPQLAKQFLWCCKRCIDAAMASTAVFDGVANPLQDKRLKVTNIHGTATAQFSNMLVLVAVTRSWLAVMVDTNRLKQLMERTIALHDKLSPLAPIFRINRKILAAARDDLRNAELMKQRGYAAWQTSPGSVHGSHPSMSPGSAGTPRPPYAQPPSNSTHTSFSSVAPY